MHKSTIFILFIFFVFFLTLIHGKPLLHHQQQSSTSPTATFLKPKASLMRHLNPLKLLFTVVHTPNESPAYKIEWNLPFLKTMLLGSKHVTDDDKKLFLLKFSNTKNDYSQWSEQQHNQLERFTEKYFNLYETANSFLPFLDCPALTYAITDELLSALQPHINEEKRSKVRAMSVERLCNTE